MLLEVDSVIKRFGGLIAVNRVSLGVEEGEIFGLIGPNGAGKTTLLNVIAGVYRQNEGTVKFKGENISGYSPEKVCWRGISRTFQVPHRFQKMSVLENVVVASTFGNRQTARNPLAAAEEALNFTKFTIPKDTLAGKLNAGQLKRLDLARALASPPRLLLLDEPASGLTPMEVEGLMELIREIRSQGVTVILVEHLMKMIMKICDRMVVLDYGVKIAEGKPDEIARNPKVIEAYLGSEYLHEMSAQEPETKEAGSVRS